VVLAELEPRQLTAAVLRPAAVLVPLLRRPQGPTFLLIRRRHDLHEHAGQVAFPGGRLDEGESVEAGALREAGEEINLSAASVEIVGRLDDQPSPSRYRVAPVVGLVRDPPPLVAEPGEITEMFEVPLARLLQPGRVHAEWWPASRLPAGAPLDVLMDPHAGYSEVDRRGMRYKVYFFDTDGGPERVIWGLTARIVSQILVLAFAFTLPEPRAR
jgi:8-oxo-dGTP pyrophosphatase MutT (NUDIX family)